MPTMTGGSVTWPHLRRGLVAILRGLKPDEALDIGAVLVKAGFEIIEVPLNSPDPFASIAALHRSFGSRALIGAGTVLTLDEVDRLAAAGGRIMVSPNVDPAVIGHARAHGMVTMPGVFTPTEALLALASGASGLKFFPASVLGAKGIAAIKAVLPANTPLGAVGGISEDDFAAYRAVGVTTFGLGSSLFKPGMTVAQVAARAEAAIARYDAVVSA